MPWLREVHGETETHWWMANVVLRDLSVRVATLDQRIAGFAAIRPGWLDHLYIAPAHQRAGLGTRLLAEARRIGGVPLRLWAFQRNHAARAFYRRHGFIEEELTDGAGNEEHEPDVRMIWSAPCTS
ncbi:MAG: GNAT family N-acetyltransferase [Alphaproteobacteria bacterium]|nr:GNAT family N-acetyltransferase [Alphaproteobacteria bacterium]MCW5740674.1 GNAT family N-acetyltransferase [Alphaproteobacteria bacterium]